MSSIDCAVCGGRLKGAAVFGFGKSKGEKIALRIERIMMSMEMAANKGKWDVAVYASQQMVQAMRQLFEETNWGENELNTFLIKRGLVRYIADKEYRKWLENNMPPHLA